MGSVNRGTAIAPLSTIGTRYGNSVSFLRTPFPRLLILPNLPTSVFVRLRKESGKTKTPQTVTLQVKIERGQKSIKNSAHSSRPCSCLPRALKFPSTKKQLTFHLQCYHLQCFSFARKKVLSTLPSLPSERPTKNRSDLGDVGNFWVVPI